MDHLPIPKVPVHEPVVVRLRKVEEYHGPFEDFLARHGWDLPRFRDADLVRTHLVELLELLQRWLYFGLLEECLSCPEASVVRDWTRVDADGHIILSTTSLSRRLAQIDLSGPKRKHISACLSVSIEFINWLVLVDSPLVDSPDYLVIAALSSTIEKYIEANTEGENKAFYRAQGSLHVNCSKYLRNRMLDDGWCPSDVHRLCAQLDLSSLYFASNLERPDQHWHHGRCSDKMCQNTQVDESQYQTVHDLSKCDGTCAFIGVDRAELARILLSGTIPLISYDAERSPPLTLVPAASDTPWVALSHVWSHGLGNPLDNALPRCQVERLSNLVDALPGRMGAHALFWMDTLCFPLHHQEAADAAVVSMRRSYRDARSVLVVDRYLTSTNAQPLDPVEIFLRVFCSSWMRRLWTFQEGALARTLFFQFVDQAIDAAQVEMMLMSHSGPKDNLPIYSAMRDIRDVRRTADEQGIKQLLNSLAGGLCWRSTSVASDEALCLATLCGVEMERLMEAAPEERMSRFWAIIPDISAQAVFWSGSRLRTDGFRWAPATFLGQPDAIFQDLNQDSCSEAARDGSVATLTTRGLLFRCGGILLNTWRSPLGEKLWIKTGNHWFNVRRQSSDVLRPRLDEDGEPSKTLALLLKAPLGYSFRSDQPENSVTCIIVSIYDVDEDNDIVYANVEDTAFVSGLALAERLVGENMPFKIIAELGELQLRFLDFNGLTQAERDRSPGLASTQAQLFARMQQLKGSDETVRNAKARARDEDGRLSVDLDGMHYIFYGAELDSDQQWCLD